MSLTAVRDQTAQSPASRSGFYALFERFDSGLLSKRVNQVTVEVLSGTVERGDPIEFVRPDGTLTPALVKKIVANPLDRAKAWLSLDDPQPPAKEFGRPDVVRSPGLPAPVPSPADERAGWRILEAIRTARLHGFPNTPAARPVLETTVNVAKLSERFQRLPDEAVLLLVQKRLSAAMAYHPDPKAQLPACTAAAAHLEAIGLREDGDRLVLAAAAALQGHGISPSMRALEAMVAGGAKAVEQGVKADEFVSFVGSLIGGGDAFNAGAQLQTKNEIVGKGKAAQAALVGSGRAIALGWCKRCRDIVQLDAKQRCQKDHKTAEDPLAVVPSDAAYTQAVLQLRHGVAPTVANRPIVPEADLFAIATRWATRLTDPRIRLAPAITAEKLGAAIAAVAPGQRPDSVLAVVEDAWLNGDGSWIVLSSGRLFGRALMKQPLAVDLAAIRSIALKEDRSRRYLEIDGQICMSAPVKGGEAVPLFRELLEDVVLAARGLRPPEMAVAEMA